MLSQKNKTESFLHAKKKDQGSEFEIELDSDNSNKDKVSSFL